MIPDIIALRGKQIHDLAIPVVPELAAAVAHDSLVSVRHCLVAHPAGVDGWYVEVLVVNHFKLVGRVYLGERVKDLRAPLVVDM